MNSPRRKRSFYIYLKSNIRLYQIDAGWFDEDGAGWSFAQSQAGELWQAVFSRAGSVREGCGALCVFSARLGCLLVGGVSVMLVANPSANHTLWGRSLSLSSFYTWGNWGTGVWSHYGDTGRVPVTELGLWDFLMLIPLPRLYGHSLSPVSSETMMERDIKRIALESKIAVLTS